MLTKKCGSALTKRGFKKGNVFAILLPNNPGISHNILRCHFDRRNSNSNESFVHRGRNSASAERCNRPTHYNNTFDTTGYQIYLGRSDFVRKLRPPERIKQSWINLHSNPLTLPPFVSYRLPTTRHVECQPHVHQKRDDHIRDDLLKSHMK